MKPDTDTSSHNFYVTIFESELRLIAADAAEWDGVETGGDLYGLMTHGRRPVVFLALLPGTDAVHQATHFAQDLTHHKRIAGLLSGHFGIQVVGARHSHHRLNLAEPSDGDVRQVQSITGKNGIEQWLDMIVTYQDECQERPWDSSSQGRCSPSGPRFRHSPNIRINAFVYTDPPAGERQRCPLKVIPGISPVRQALIGSGLLSDSELGFQGWEFPMNKILFDAYDPSSAASMEHNTVPEELRKQVLALPEEVLKGIAITPRGSFFLVAIPLTECVELRIAFNPENRQPIRAVHLYRLPEGGNEDVTERIVTSRRCATIAEVYAHLYCGLKLNSETTAASGCVKGTSSHTVRSATRCEGCADDGKRRTQRQE